MVKSIFIFGIGLLLMSCSSKPNSLQMKAFLAQQLKNTHTQEEWFAPTKVALNGVTFEQASWKDSTTNHSIGELTSHLLFWNETNLRAFKSENVSDLNIKNEETFEKYSEEEWEETLRKLDSIQTEWETLVENATEKQINDWGSEIANMCTHTAYHTGQIVYIRKQNGWWKQ